MDNCFKQMKLIIVMLFISSFSLLLSFFADFNGNAFNLMMAYGAGILFWGCLIAAYVLLAVINEKRKKSEARRKTDLYENETRKVASKRNSNRPGIINFCSNKYAMIFDTLMVVFLILTIVFSFIPVLNSVAIICISVLIFSVHMHCVLNGMNFRYIFRNKGEQDNEQR